MACVPLLPSVMFMMVVTGMPLDVDALPVDMPVMASDSMSMFHNNFNGFKPFIKFLIAEKYKPPQL